jgi:cyanophycin synthetase
LPPQSSKKKSFVIEEKIVEAKAIAADYELGPSGRTIVEAAEKRGIPWRRENDTNSLIQLGYGKNLRLIQAAMTDRTGIIAADLAGNKDATKRTAEEFSMPVPYGKIVRSEEQAVRALESDRRARRRQTARRAPGQRRVLES